MAARALLRRKSVKGRRGVRGKNAGRFAETGRGTVGPAPIAPDHTAMAILAAAARATAGLIGFREPRNGEEKQAQAERGRTPTIEDPSCCWRGHGDGSSWKCPEMGTPPARGNPRRERFSGAARLGRGGLPTKSGPGSVDEFRDRSPRPAPEPLIVTPSCHVPHRPAPACITRSMPARSALPARFIVSRTRVDGRGRDVAEFRLDAAIEAGAGCRLRSAALPSVAAGPAAALWLSAASMWICIS